MKILKPCSLLLVLCGSLAASIPGAARAGDQPSASESTTVPDSVLTFAKNQAVVITLRDGREIIGTPAAYDPQSVTLIEDGTGRVVALPRAELVALRLRAAATVAVASPPPGPAVPATPARKRHVGLQISQGPGNLLLDLEYGHFYGFLGTSIGYPVIFSGDNQSQYAAGVIGLGGTWRLSARNAWQFDLTGTLTPTYWGGFSAGIGIAAGFHYTTANGFTIGFKIPVFGLAPGCNENFGKSSYDTVTGDPSPHCAKKVTSGADLIGNYYLQAAMSLPIISLGYRF